MSVHDSKTCDCEVCQWANQKEIADDLTEFELEKSLSDFRARFGDERLMSTIEVYLVREGLY